MNPRPIDLKELKQQETRLRAYKENSWNRNEGFEPFEMALLVLLTGVVLAVGALLILCIVWAKYSN
jgi:hypothetical protein